MSKAQALGLLLKRAWKEQCSISNVLVSYTSEILSGQVKPSFQEHMPPQELSEALRIKSWHLASWQALGS